jgi:hypothetical protein
MEGKNVCVWSPQGHFVNNFGGEYFVEDFKNLGIIYFVLLNN